MHAHHRLARARRRGIVLVLILAMLGLLALIGVSFATFSGQAQSGTRKYLEAAYTPTSDSMMDYALSQLINDTTNPLSAFYGHGLKRDMYGNDASNNGYLDFLPALPSGSPGGPAPGPILLSSPAADPVLSGYTRYTTNIPYTGSLANLNFTRWIVRLPGTTAAQPVAQTFEVLRDSPSTTSTTTAVHQLTLSNPDPTLSTNPSTGATVGLATTYANVPIVLDGRFRHAFNGAGLGTMAQNGNLRLAGINPNVAGVEVDEDYDAPDLENWFLALQSADGGVVIPSFHRPSILGAADWTTSPGVGSPKILRPRAIDHGNNTATFPDLIPDKTGSPLAGASFNANYGKIKYDVDNDGDGVTDAVWIDGGFPAQRDPMGKLFKPLFAITVLGLNGKLPLNTVGNIQGRHPDSNSTTTPTYNAGDPTFSHTSHLGFSVNEISPLYALQNAAGFGLVDNQGVRVDTTQLRNLLCGTRPFDPNNPGLNDDNNTVAVPGGTMNLPNNLPDDGTVPANRSTAAVAGRWGESEWVPKSLPAAPAAAPYLAFNNIIRAGRTNLLPTSPVSVDWDMADDDGDTNDFLPRMNPASANYSSGGSFPTTMAGYTAHPELGDYYDSAGSIPIPSERIRRFVKPIDPSGNGRIMPYNAIPTSAIDHGTGPDANGRTSHHLYFRPPGMPQKVVYADSTPSPAIAQLYTDPPAYESPFSTQMPVQPDPTNNNPMHGYQSELNPASGASPFGAMPFNNSNSTATPPDFPTALPTFVGPINSLSSPTPGNGYTPSIDVYRGYPLGSLNLDEADEMNLYAPTKHDAPFGPEDLEWLYRKQDVDGASLDSRLAKLAPVSFTNSGGPALGGGLTRRRLFSTDTWETTNFVWAYDNPGAGFPNNSRFPSGAYASYSSFSAPANSGLSSPTPTPSLAHRDRKINLNFPLPVSNSPIEPVRQKWIRETYSHLKAILPPEAVDTPEELAQLSQFVVNIVDFRDPDGAITKFVNTDLEVVAAVAATSGATGTPGTASGVQYTTAADVPTTPYDPSLDPAVSTATTPPPYLVQYGMEYCPLAINEVLGYQFVRKDTTTAAPTATPRLFVELVNTLTQGAPPTTGTNQDSDIDLNGWELVLVVPASATAAPSGEDYTCRPDPVTGQIPSASTSATQATQIVMPLKPQTPAAGPPPFTVPAMNNTVGPGAGRYYVVSNPKLDAQSENGTVPFNSGFPGATPTVPVKAWMTPTGLITVPATPPTTAPTDPLATLPALTTGQGKYYWIYLRRPINPLVPSSPKVVVDSMRFPYVEGGGIPVAGPPETVDRSNARDLYSVQRLQPYRGGQAVPTGATATTPPPQPSPPNPYGFSEQTAPAPITTATQAGSLYGIYAAGPNPPSTTPTYTQMTGTGVTPAPPAPPAPPQPNGNGIGETLGNPNSPNEPWDLVTIHDRDFMSVAELLLVPGCPPGLFTKKFVEQPPPLVQPNTTVPDSPSDPTPPNSPYPYVTPPRVPPQNYGNIPAGTPDPRNNVFVGRVLRPDVPHPFPCLVDNFYYTATDDATAGKVGGTSAAGWFRMFEFFEVPSSSFGAIGPVGQGQNFDWLRQDVKPGLLNLNLIIDEEVFFGLIDDPRLNYNGVTATSGLIPSVVTTTDVDTNTSQPYAAPMTDRGYLDPTLGTPVTGLKVAFSDFLKLRHGGSNYLYGYGTNGLGSDRPFHSLSYPDIDYTVMRPAALTATNTNPGVMNPSYTAPFPVPLRRLFQIPDYTIPAPVPTPPAPFTAAQSPASANGDPNINTTNQVTNLSDPDCSLVDTPGTSTFASGTNWALGAPPTAGGTDRRTHPAFRTEWLQKVMNLTTVRTHQFAVWVTVGFFEVTQTGNPLSTSAALQYDHLGLELGAQDGRNIRYRSFFILDRTRAGGYNPADPGDFREVVVYRRRIE